MIKQYVIIFGPFVVAAILILTGVYFAIRGEWGFASVLVMAGLLIGAGMIALITSVRIQ